MNFLSTAWEWQWADLVITIVGSLLGFLFAIFATIGTNKIVDYCKAKNLIKDLKEEFEKEIVPENKSKILATIANEDETDFTVLSLPHLERAVFSNEIQVLSGKKYFNTIMKLYNNMNSINDWYAELSKYVLQNVVHISNKQTEEAKIYSFMCKAVAKEAEVNYFNVISVIIDKINDIKGE